MRRITMNVTDAQYEALKTRERETGCTQSEQIRRAINLTLFADAQQQKPTREER
jgi:hypothetical protein